jgi:predicted MPP superfamily phosphohydrolase
MRMPFGKYKEWRLIDRPEPVGYTYVNRGIGTLVFTFRIGAPPVITCFTLHNLT